MEARPRSLREGRRLERHSSMSKRLPPHLEPVATLHQALSMVQLWFILIQSIPMISYVGSQRFHSSLHLQREFSTGSSRTAPRLMKQLNYQSEEKFKNIGSTLYLIEPQHLGYMNQQIKTWILQRLHHLPFLQKFQCCNLSSVTKSHPRSSLLCHHHHHHLESPVQFRFLR